MEKKLGVKYIIIDEEVDKDNLGINCSSFLFEFDNKKFTFYYLVM